MEQALTLSQFGLWVFLLAQFVLYGVFLRMAGKFLQGVRQRPPVVKRASLTVNDLAPAFRAVDQVGRMVEVGVAQERAVLLLFVLSTCQICHEILPRLQEVKGRYPELDLIVIASEEGEFGAISEDVSLIRSQEIRKQYFAKYVPAMVMVSRDSRVLGTARAVSFGDFENRLKRYVAAAGLKA